MSAQYVEPTREIALSDGTVLSSMGVDELDKLRGSVKELMARIGRTPHYARKNRTNLQMLEDDQRNIDAELARRKLLNEFDLFGWKGKFVRVFKNQNLQEWSSKEEVPVWAWTDDRLRAFFKGPTEIIEEAPGVSRVQEAKLIHVKPSDPRANLFMIVDHLMEFLMEGSNLSLGLSAWKGSWRPFAQTILIPYTAYKAMKAAGATYEDRVDPLCPWKIGEEVEEIPMSDEGE